MRELSQFTRILDNLSRVYPTLPGRAATVAVNFTKERFRDEAWLDVTKNKWQPRKHSKNARDRSRKTLTKTARLKRSVRKDRVTPNYAIIAVGGTGINYARIHNEGGRVNETVKVRAHSRNRAGRTEQVKAHIRKVDFIMPKRQFIGNSVTLDKRIQLQLTADISRALKT